MLEKIFKSIKNILLVSIPSLLFTILILEVFFRFVIIASNPPLSEYDKELSYPKFSNNQKTGTYTIGKFAQIKSKWSINNYGFNSSQDFKIKNERDSTPLICVLGDSYIEAFQVDVDKNYPALLNKNLKDYDVYGVGISGSPLSEYLHFNKIVNQLFDPKIIVYQLVHNDFDESLLKYNPNSMFHTLDTNEKGDYYLKAPSENNISPTSTSWKKLLYKSATFRYLHLNLLIFQLFKSKPKQDAKTTTYEANTAVIAEEGKINEIRKGISYLFDCIKKENEGKRVVFVLDAPRSSIYTGELSKSKVLWMHEMVKELVQKNNFELIDLTQSMEADFAKNKKKFNSETDAHWNEYGHEFVANTLQNYITNIKNK